MIASLRCLFVIALAALSSAAFAGTPRSIIETAPKVTPIYRDSALDLETGMLWEAGHSTSIDYRLVPTQLAWRSPRVFGFDFADGSALVLRHRIGLLGTWVERGPEHQYLGFMFSPSIEYWNAAQTWALYSGAGGGFGWIDSQGVEGGQGRDLTLNWFGQLGVQHALTDALSLRAGAMFQHMSNGGATDPNPGINAVGFTVGCSWRF